MIELGPIVAEAVDLVDAVIRIGQTLPLVELLRAIEGLISEKNGRNAPADINAEVAAADLGAAVAMDEKFTAP